MAIITPKTYFQNLDGIRALACLSVFFAHAYMYVNNRVITNRFELWFNDHLVAGGGPMGVSLFFVLSGFLITYLLISEKENSGSISLKNFYLKRVLRIWPMFFAVVILGFFIIPAITNGLDFQAIKNHLPWFLLFSYNFDRIHTHFAGFGNDSLGALWSVAVEEQFYLFWPLVILLFRKKLLPFLMLLLITGSYCFRYFHSDSTYVVSFHTLSAAGDLAIGGLVAWSAFYYADFRSFFNNVVVKTTGYLCLFTLIFNHNLLLATGVWAAPGRLLLAMGFGFLIADQCFSMKRVVEISRFKFLSKLGMVSYGFYCLHMFVIMLVQKINAHQGIEQISTGMFYLEFIGLFIITFLLAYLSYRYFESIFLRMKDKIHN